MRAIFCPASDWETIIKDSLVEDLDGQMPHTSHNDSGYEDAINDDTLSLRPSRSYGSLIDHNLLSPTISSATLGQLDPSVLHI